MASTDPLLTLRDQGLNNLEDNVNGTWNTTLATYFRFTANPVPPAWNNTWYIFPEALSPQRTQGRKADLVVGQMYQNANNVPDVHIRVVFEGKGRSSNDNFPAIAGQLRDWMNDCPFSQHNQRRTWIMGAKGSRVAFWVWDAAQAGDNRLRNISGFNNGAPTFVQWGQPNIIWEFDVGQNLADIGRVLAYMAANPIPQVP